MPKTFAKARPPTKATDTVELPWFEGSSSAESHLDSWLQSEKSRLSPLGKARFLARSQMLAHQPKR